MDVIMTGGGHEEQAGNGVFAPIVSDAASFFDDGSFILCC